MRKIVLVALMCLSMNAFSLPPQKRGVVRDTICNASWTTVLRAMDRFCYEFQSSPDSLFSWAFVGTGGGKIKKQKSKESRNAIQLRYKERIYDPTNKTGDVAIDIYVLGTRWFKDQHLGTKYILSRPAKAKFPLTSHLKATYSGSLLEGGDIIMRIEPISATQTKVHYEFSLVLGKVLSSFISDKTWHNTAEWRLNRIFNNIIEYCETGTVKRKSKKPASQEDEEDMEETK